MSLVIATWTGAIATVVLAVGAIVTSVFATRAFRKQSEEVRLLQQASADQQELARQQAELLKVQAGQLDLQTDSSLSSGLLMSSRSKCLRSRPRS